MKKSLPKQLNMPFVEQVNIPFQKIHASIPALQLPPMNEEMIDADLDLAPHLKPLRNLRLDKSHACCVIRSETKELGLLAAAYVAARHGAVYLDTLLDAEDYNLDRTVACECPHCDPVFFQNTLPIYSMKTHPSFFDEESEPSDNYMLTKQGEKIRLPHWSQLPCEHPLILLLPCPDASDSELMEELNRQTAMRSLTLVVMPLTNWQPRDSFFSAFESNTVRIANELQFSFAADVATLHLPKPASQHNKLLLKQLLEERNLSLDADCRPETVLKRLESFRAKSYGVTNTNLLKYVRLLDHLYGNHHPLVLTRQQALKPLTLTSNQKKSPKKRTARPEIQLYGCENVKRQLRSVVDTMRIDQERRAKELPSSQHGQVLLFAGAPGTGKTTAARMLHQWLEKEDLLDDGFDTFCDYHQVSGAQLKAPFVGQTAPLIHNLFESHAFIFIDEAYALAESGQHGANNDHFAQEAMGQLCIELENLPANHVVIFAGYGGDHDNRMRSFLNANPGLASRITHTIQFDPYSPEKELPQIFFTLAEERGLKLPAPWRSMVVPYFQHRARQEDFGSGREARRLLESCLTVQAHRLVKEMNFHTASLNQLTEGDLRRAVEDLESGFRALEEQSTLPCGLGHNRPAPDQTEA